MHHSFDLCFVLSSPSLRGSGLKCRRLSNASPVLGVSLFTREWIEITKNVKLVLLAVSPSLRGSGLKSVVGRGDGFVQRSPSLRGSGLKLFGRMSD